MESQDLVGTQPNFMSDKDGKSIVSRPTRDLARTRPGAAAIIDRMIDGAADIFRRRDAVQRISGDHEFGEPNYRDTDEDGGSTAQGHRDETYRYDEGVPEDDAEAVRWCRRAAVQGDADAQNQLGDMYFYGTGVPEDEAEAAKWYRRAAEQGDASAQFHLGLKYLDGEGVPQDYARAYGWLNLAAARFPASEQGSRDEAVEMRDEAASLLTPADLARAQRWAREWEPGTES
jgi:hypothetical protein